MQRKEQKFQPVLLGSDINVYGMARSFYEEYGVTSIAYASEPLAATKYSKIVDVRVHPGFDKDPVFLETLLQVATERPADETKYLLIACGDGYVQLVAKHQQELAKDYLCPFIDEVLFKQLSNKVSFYETCEAYGLPYPQTLIVTQEMVASKPSIVPPFEFPVALKPANSVEYLTARFEGRKKAFTIKSQAELDLILQRIYAAGYTSEMICQDFIPGDDSQMRVLNAYVDRDSQVRMMCLGHPMLEDPTPSAIGNYMTILPDFDEATYQTIKGFLEKIQYKGFANFDMKYDVRDGKYKLFEINLRQGRSSFYVTLNGYNLARYVTEELVFGHAFTETVYGKGNKLWMGIPEKIFKQYATEGPAKERALKMLAENNWGTTVFYQADWSLKRYVLMKYMFFNYYKRYRQYFNENKG